MPPQIEKIVPFDENENKNIEQSLSEYPSSNVLNIRKYLLTLIFVQWLVFVITLGVGIYSITMDSTIDVDSGMSSLLPIIGFVIYYTFGLLVTFKQHRVGLLTFAYIGVALFIVICFLAGYIFLAVVALGVGFGNTSQTQEFIGFMTIVFILVAIVVILTLKFSFNLAKSIKRNEYSTV